MHLLRVFLKVRTFRRLLRRRSLVHLQLSQVLTLYRTLALLLRRRLFLLTLSQLFVLLFLRKVLSVRLRRLMKNLRLQVMSIRRRTRIKIVKRPREQGTVTFHLSPRTLNFSWFRQATAIPVEQAPTSLRLNSSREIHLHLLSYRLLALFLPYRWRAWRRSRRIT